MPAMKVAIVGCGAVAQLYYAPALIAIGNRADVSVAALIDPARARADLLAQSFPNATVSDNLDALSALEIDLAILASPAMFHAQQCVELLKNNIAVLCEKPMATNVRDAEQMIAQANASGKILAIGLVRRFFPALQEIKRFICARELGAVKYFQLSDGGAFEWLAQSSSLFDKRTAGGGVLLDLGAHVLDLVDWWFGPPTEVSYADDAMGGLEANCRVDLSFAGGLKGHIRLSREATYSCGYRIEFEKGSIAWRVGEASSLQIHFNGSSRVFNGQFNEHCRPELLPVNGGNALTFEQCFINQLLNVIAAVRGESALLVPGSVGIAGVRLAEACYKKRKLLDMPWLTESELAMANKLNSEVR